MRVSARCQGETLAIELPGAESSAPSEEDFVRVFLSESGELRLEEKEILPAQLEDALRRRLQETGIDKFLLVADRRARLEDTVAAIDAARLAGFRSVAIATRRESAGGGETRGGER